MNKLISLQDSINLLPDGVLIVVDQHRIEMVNNRAGKLFGYRPDELVGQELTRLIPARYHHQHTHHVAGFFQHPTVRQMGEGKPMFGLRQDGSEFDVDIALSPVVLNGTPMVIAVVRDISDKKDMERALQWKNEQLEAINVELERFGFTISHDLKSPLANIHAILHLITRELPADKKEALREHILELNHTLYSMSDLIAGVAAYSKATLSDAGDVAVDMNQVLTEVKYLVLLPSHIQLEIAEPLPATWGNKTKLLQVFLNLISNAIKYNDKEQGLIRVSGQVRGDEARYFVEDNGPGIALELRAKVFTLFEKGTSTRSDSQGIGLAIVSKVVQQQGGSIGIEESELGGARFALVLPGSVGRSARNTSDQP
ncbi:MAG: PAS domain S-box protein [Hymenobacteraceae bacterium]|nr:PAS domain S-box protein [Hymenobacteraceae bacterium]